MDPSSVCVTCKLCIHTFNIWLKQPPQITLVTLVSIKVPNSRSSLMLSLPAETTSPPYFSPLHLSSSSPKYKELLISLIYKFLTQLLPTGFFTLFCFRWSRNLASLPWQNRTKLTNTVFFFCCLKKNLVILAFLETSMYPPLFARRRKSNSIKISNILSTPIAKPAIKEKLNAIKTHFPGKSRDWCFTAFRGEKIWLTGWSEAHISQYFAPGSRARVLIPESGGFVKYLSEGPSLAA